MLDAELRVSPESSQLKGKDVANAGHRKPGFSQHLLARKTEQEEKLGRAPAAPAQSYHSALGSLLISKGNNLFRDKELDGLLLPVVYVAVQLVSVHT